MIREARGFFDAGGTLQPAPRIRIGVSFGPDRVIALPALVDTGADVCVVPQELVPWPLPDDPTVALLVEIADGGQFPITAHFPAITVGDIRLRGVATIVLPGAEPILGRSFLNLCEVHLSAKRGLVRLRTRQDGGS